MNVRTSQRQESLRSAIYPLLPMLKEEGRKIKALIIWAKALRATEK